MSSTPWEHQGEAREALRAIVSDPDYGKAALSSSQTMSNLLKDYLPDAPREKGVLVAAAEAGLAGILQDHVARGVDPRTAAELTAASFAANTAYPPDACSWVVDELAVALGLMAGTPAAEPRRDEQGWGTGHERRAETERRMPPPPPPPLPPPPPRRRIPKAWAAVVAAVVVVGLIVGFVVLQSGPHPAAVESVSKIVRSDVTGCRSGSDLGMHGVVSSQFCRTSSSSIGFYAYQFDNASDYQAGVLHLGSITGFDPAVAGNGCPPPVGDAIGSGGWHSDSNPAYRARPGQDLDCYPQTSTNRPVYLWTLPTQRVALVAIDFGSGATLQNLENWWAGLTYR